MEKNFLSGLMFVVGGSLLLLEQLGYLEKTVPIFMICVAVYFIARGLILLGVVK